MLKHDLLQICMAAVLLLNNGCDILTNENIRKKGKNKVTLYSAENRFERGCPRLYVDGVEVPTIFYALTDLQEAR